MSENRRKAIIKKLSGSGEPVTGGELADQFQVSRQVIVQDIAILRASGVNVLATSNGYMLPQKQALGRIVKTFISKHTGFERMREELLIIVDYGGKIIDVTVEHPIYGEIVGNLHLSTREEVESFLDRIRVLDALPLSVLTQGEHIHTIEVPSEKVFQLIMNELIEKGYAKV